MDLLTIEREVRRLIEHGQPEQAEALLRQVLSSGSGPIPLWRMLWQVIRPLGKIEETKHIQQLLVDAVPGDLSARFDLAETLLLLGEFERGWREYHYRYSLPHTTRIERKVQRPRWDGRPIPGKTLLIHDEQGFGDTFQFMRQLPAVKARSQATVIFEINPETHSIAERAKGFDVLSVRGSLPPMFDSHCELMSLPMVMGFDVNALPGPIPYLSADPGRVAHWQRRLNDLPRPLVGLVWAGRPTHSNDANRSLTLAQLAPLGASTATFLALQKGPKADEGKNPPAGFPVLSLSEEINDFEDTAAILSIIDLLISVDSSPIHLAGALGRPVWVMVPFIPDWRWLLHGEQTPWYPSMRLFRQSAAGDWPAVIECMVTALRGIT